MNPISSGKPQVTVLMPNYNNEPFLQEAIDSILDQTFTNFIFLIIDDGSTDKSIEIIESYKDPRILLIRKQPNSGIVDTLNLGLKQISTKYFVRMDGDDRCPPQRIQLLYDFMEKHPETGVCGSHLQLFGSSEEIWRQELDKNKIKAKTIYCSAVSHGPSIFRTGLLTENSIYYRNEHPYMEDYDLFFRLKRITEFAHLDEVLYYYRMLDHNSTVKNQHTLLQRYKEIYKKVLAELELPVTEENLRKHLQLFLGDPPTFKISEYRRYIDKLLEQNLRLKIYPQKELKDLLDEKWEQFFFKIVPSSFGNNITYFFSGGKFSAGRFSYLLKYKINRLIGRN